MRIINLIYWNIYFKFKIIYNGFGDNMNLEKLSLEEKIGQKFMFGINSHNIDIIINLIKKYSIGGVILYKKNYNSYDEMLSVIKKLKEANKENKVPLFIAIDQEGGRVNRMPSEFNNLKNIYDVSKKDEKLVVKHADITGRMLKQLGINMNFAPVLDVYENKKSKVLYKRCFYGDYKDVSRNGIKYIDGLVNTGIIPVVKHFPGHGISAVDSHFITPYVKDYDSVLNRHIKPFEEVIASGCDAVMVNHLVIRNLTNKLPASISKTFIEEYLRKRNNFNGLVITDEINMLGRNIFYKFNYVEKVINSGSDIILVKVKDNSNIKIIDKFIKYVYDNPEYINELDSSVKRIIDVKNKYGVSDEILNDNIDIDKFNKEIDNLNGLCL